jgi:hypothetical protein
MEDIENIKLNIEYHILDKTNQISQIVDKIVIMNQPCVEHNWYNQFIPHSSCEGDEEFEDY